MRIKALTVPTDLVVSLDDIKEHLNLNSGNDEDAVLTRFAHAAREQFEWDTDNRILLATSFLQSLNCWTSLIQLKAVTVQEITSIKYYNTEDDLVEEDLEEWITDDAGITTTIYRPKGDYPALSWKRIHPIQIEFVAGFSEDDSGDTEIPASIQTALLELVGHWYEHREAFAEGPELRAVPKGWDNFCRQWRTGLGVI